MEKIVVVFLMETVIISPIILGAHFHGQYSYKQYYEHVNNGQLKDPTTCLREMVEELSSNNNKACLNQTFCEDLSCYPQEHVNNILTQNSSLLHYSREDTLELAARFDNEEQPLCPSREQLSFPRIAKNQNDEWQFIVQSSEMNFHQGIRMEICNEKDAKCRIIDGFAEGYTTMCKQKYVYRELVALSDDGQPDSDYFAIPASCCCHVQFEVEEMAM
ncbi:hypothetical protein PUN28_007788 [Cardiocondyla obscurior]|uniref:Spaetzle domain-containing protein n=1 Tax=Cardiocondyla obscurior TaxID=286306 RepID=A0AAW2FWI5_9HYME